MVTFFIYALFTKVSCLRPVAYGGRQHHNSQLNVVQVFKLNKTSKFLRSSELFDQTYRCSCGMFIKAWSSLLNMLNGTQSGLHPPSESWQFTDTLARVICSAAIDQVMPTIHNIFFA